MDVLARGLQCIKEGLGPWSVHDLTLGLAVMAKVRQLLPVRHTMPAMMLWGGCRQRGSMRWLIGAALPCFCLFVQSTSGSTSRAVEL